VSRTTALVTSTGDRTHQRYHIAVISHRFIASMRVIISALITALVFITSIHVIISALITALVFIASLRVIISALITALVLIVSIHVIVLPLIMAVIFIASKRLIISAFISSLSHYNQSYHTIISALISYRPLYLAQNCFYFHYFIFLLCQFRSV